jgi:oxygen-dependent protoporphyrinogen oxidase
MMFMVPTRIAPVFASPLFSWKTRLRILREWFYKRRLSREESTVAEFIARHYGREMVERIADPLLAGVYGGSADELSVEAVLPRLAEMESRYGSLGKGMLSARRLAHGSPRKPLFTSLRTGMQQLTDAAMARIPESSRLSNSPVERVSRESNKWLIVRSGRTEEFDGVIVATPAHAASQLLHAEPALAAELQAIPYSSSVTATLIYDKAVRDSLPEGFGFLVPRTENRRILAVTFVHNKFPHRAPPDRAIVRCFLGGSRDQDILNESDDRILEIVQQELQQILGLHAKPLAVRIYRWRPAMAQYAVGHNDRVKRIRSSAGEMPGLALAGNAYSGIGVPDCIRTGAEAAAKVLKDLGLE